MKSYPRANSSEGDCVTLSVDLYNRIVEDLERLDRLSVSPPLTLNSGGSGMNIGLRLPTQSAELVLVALIGTETGGGRYKGSILTGNSTGSTSTNFQLQATIGQTATDGPAMTMSGGSPVNNALVINLPEQYVANSHVLYTGNAYYFYAWGIVMGQTKETTPRTIVYLQTNTMMPVIARITATYNATASAGVYYGRLQQGQPFNDNTLGWNQLLSAISPAFFGSNDVCWITNIWEQTSAVLGSNTNGLLHGLAVGTYVWGLLVGYAIDTPTSSTQNFYLVFTWTPTQAPATSIPATSAIQTAGGAYTSHEQGMLSQASSDIHNLQVALASLYANLRQACYSL